MKRVAIGCGVLVMIFLLVAGLSVGLKSYRSSISTGTWLDLKLEGSLYEYKPDTFVGAVFLKDEPLLRDVTDALEKAASDPKIAGVVAKIDDMNLGWGRTAEVRDAVKKFRESGKPAVCWMETAGEFGPGNLQYYLASAFDRIYLAPSGDINLLGVMSSSMFLRGTFDLLGVYPDMEHIGAYKSAMNMYTEKAYTPAHREMIEQILGSIDHTLVSAVAEGRNMSEDQVRDTMLHAPFIGAEALDAGLVDAMKYRDEVYAGLSGETGGGDEGNGGEAETVGLRQYLSHGRPGTSGSSTIAVVYGVGTVYRGKSDMDPMGGDYVMGSDSVARWLKEAGEDDSVSAIVFRVDSPGGSYTASDLIRRELVRAKEKKPVVVSMGDLAGSGGYFVSMDASEIVAEPGTLTASIGVLGGKLVLKGLYDKIGITKEHVALGPAADMFYDYQPFTKDQKDAQWRWLDRIYQDFSHKVAEGRGMKWEEVDRIGQGRVWTGADAMDLGLVDHVGGMSLALERARALADLPEDRPVRLKFYPSEKTLWEVITSSDDDVLTAASTRTLRGLVEIVRRAAAIAATAGEDQTLAMQEVPEVR